VDDEYAGRKARCPVCGTVYTVGGSPNLQSPESLNPASPADVETVYTQKNDSNSPQLNPENDSWSSMPTSKPIELPLSIPDAIALPIDSAPISSPVVLNSALPIASVKYVVRTPNSMVYGPSTAETVHEWITEGRLDDSCHIREETSEQWLGIAAWRFQSRRKQNPMSAPGYQTTNQFGDIPVSSVQSVGYAKAGNGGLVLILGLISWILCPTFIGGIVCGILAIVFGMTELKKIKNGQSPSKEKSVVLIGLLLAIANLATWCVLIVGLIVVAILNP